jgi:hypothetical protein
MGSLLQKVGRLCRPVVGIKYMYFVTSFTFLSLPSEFTPFFALLKMFLSRTSPYTVTNITNIHYHSQNLPLLLFYQHPFSYIICSNSEHFNHIPTSHDRRQLTVIIFSDCDRKCSWHINVTDHYWMISVDWRQNYSLCNSFCLSTISTYLHSITCVSHLRCSDRIPYWLRRSQ